MCIFIVDAADADIVFKASDGVLFRIHRKNLETSTGGFSPEGLTIADKELVELTEAADVLELLFQFIYPRRQPDLLNIEFVLLAEIAEAAEKYEVYAAMNTCHSRMRYVRSASIGGIGLNDGACNWLQCADREPPGGGAKLWHPARVLGRG